MKTYNDIYISARDILRQRGIEGYSLEAKLIVAGASGKSLSGFLKDMNLYASQEIENRVTDYVSRRLRGEPVAYIVGHWEFYGMPIKTTPDVLIPRMDTEVLIDAAKEQLTGHKMDARVLDLCCGSGCIACAVARELPAAKVVAIDLSASALEICRENVAQNHLSSRIICMQADATVNPPLGIGRFDMIISNPPYIPSEEIGTLDASVRDFEPVWALDGGEDGLKFYRAIIKHWKGLLTDSGCMIFEVGEGQAQTVGRMLLSAGFNTVTYKKDTLGIDRAVIARKSDWQ